MWITAKNIQTMLKLYYFSNITVLQIIPFRSRQPNSHPVEKVLLPFQILTVSFFLFTKNNLLKETIALSLRGLISDNPLD